MNEMTVLRYGHDTVFATGNLKYSLGDVLHHAGVWWIVVEMKIDASNQRVVVLQVLPEVEAALSSMQQ